MADKVKLIIKGDNFDGEYRKTVVKIRMEGDNLYMSKKSKDGKSHFHGKDFPETIVKLRQGSKLKDLTYDNVEYFFDEGPWNSLFDSDSEVAVNMTVEVIFQTVTESRVGIITVDLDDDSIRGRKTLIYYPSTGSELAETDFVELMSDMY